MASSKDFVQFVCDQIRDAGEISFTKMFGEYAVYCDGKVAALVCDDQVFVKKIDAAAAILGENTEEAPPYLGAKMHFLVTDLDDRQLMMRLMRAVWNALPPPKPKKAKAPKASKAMASKAKTPSAKSSLSTAARLTAEFLALKDDKQAVHLARFFKTAPGQYGEGDRFLGIKVPVTRSLVEPYIAEATLADCDKLLKVDGKGLMNIMRTLVLAMFLFVLFAVPVPAPEISGCTIKGIRLYGKVKVVTSFADLKVQVVNSFPDLKVQEVRSFPSSCGKWQFVDSFPDFTIQYVQSFPDIKVQFVNSFPGVP